MPTPDLGGVPAPTLLLAGGLLAGAALALLARVVNRAGARRRARRAARALDAGVRAVADELVLAPLQAELDVHAGLVDALGAADGERVRARRRDRPATAPAAPEPSLR